MMLNMYYDKHQEIEDAKNRILAELEFCYEQIETRNEFAKNIYRKKAAMLEKMFNAYDNNGDCTVEDLL